MKKIKKMIAVLLAFVLLFSSISILASAADTSASNKYPFILIHGLGGWGYYDSASETSPYWGGGIVGGDNGDIVKVLRDNGYEAYAASVGPVNSAWDRCCELYAQLTGTVVDYGEAHSKAHNHDRYGKSFEGKPLMGEVWNIDDPINLIGHSFGGPASRLFASLLAYGDEAEIAATGENTSPLFMGGHSKSVHSVITLSGCHNGSQIANLIVDPVVPLFMIAVMGNAMGAMGMSSILFWDDLGVGQFGLTAKEGEDRAAFSLCKCINFVMSKDNAGYDLTIGGSQELNEKIKMSPDTYYYSVSGTVTEENCFGYQQQTHDTSIVFAATTVLLSLTQGLTIDGIKMDETWANNDGMVPLASALYPLDEADNAFSYEEAFENGTIKPGSWYYFEPIYGMDHGDYCGTADYPEGGYEGFYLNLASIASAR